MNKASLSSRLHKVLPTTGDFIVGLTFLFALTPMMSYDVWWHLAIGREIVQTGEIPATETFSFASEGKPWIAHEWLTDLLFYALVNWCDYSGLVLFRALLITMTLTIVYRTMVEASRNPLLCFGLYFLVAATHSVGWVDRPQVISMLFFALYVRWLRSLKPKRLAGLANFLVIMGFWANLHGAFVLGVLLIGLSFAGQALELGLNFGGSEPLRSRLTIKLGLLLVITVMLVAANPAGLRLLTYPLQYLGHSVHHQFIQEWRPPDFAHLPIFEIYFLLVVSVLIISRRGLAAADFLYFAVFAHFSLRSMRGIPFFVQATAAILAEQAAYLGRELTVSEQRPRAMISKAVAASVSKLRSLAELFRKQDRDSRPSLVSYACVVGLSFAFMQDKLPWIKSPVAWSQYPVAAGERILNDLPVGNVFALYEWGGYLVWRLYPQKQVFIDGRTDVHGESLIKEYQAISKAEQGYQERLAQREIGIVLVKRDSRLALALKQEPDWFVDYEDELCTLLLRRDSSATPEQEP